MIFCIHLEHYEYFISMFIRDNGGTAQFARIRLDKTQEALNNLRPEIELLDPVERLERLQPLERQAQEYQTKVCHNF